VIRINKLTDYAVLVLTHAAREAAPSYTARDLAAKAHVPLPTVSKILKELHKAGIVSSHRGIKGGYSLSRAPEHISVAEVVQALEGPIALTECSGTASGLCGLEPGCLVRANWRTISAAVRGALEHISLAALAQPLTLDAVTVAHVSHPHPDPLPPTGEGTRAS
jgi:FeS assembly SUF system regulator